MICVPELRITEARRQIWQYESRVLLKRLTHQTKASAQKSNTNDHFDQEAQSFLSICIRNEQATRQRQRQQLDDDQARLKNVSTQSEAVAGSGRTQVGAWDRLDKGKRGQ